MLRRTAIAFAALSAASWAFASGPSTTEPAQAAALAWLNLVDAADSRSSWEQASVNFKSAVTSAQWSQALNGVRGPLGALRQREQKTAQSTKSLPGAPDGQYVVLQYQSSFQSKANATETVTVVLDPDGSWRVVGYFIK
ncbi:DUF4019 domain-containing protein [Aquariibacter albus]|uniref:DUF4019 domain-containing protein n=1 Tax=Aquariibacter albus TaxID=2759899 RepID=A0A839HM97_9BURK|nr:DUF4019 domain-containing protein [Aquariibacter albus]